MGDIKSFSLKPINYELVREGMLQEASVKYDFKKEFKAPKGYFDLVKEENPIKRFLKYKWNAQKGSRLDCDMTDLAMNVQCVFLQSRGFIVKGYVGRKIECVDAKKGEVYYLETDTINSFWGIYRRALEDYVNELWTTSSIKYKESLNYIYDFILHFGGIAKNFKAAYGVTKEDLLQHFKCDDNSSLYIQALHGNNSSAKLLEMQRLEWLLRDDVFDFFNEINMNKSLAEFATLTHTMGNFNIGPVGFNCADIRAKAKHKDRIDLFLKSLCDKEECKDWLKWFSENIKATALEMYFEKIIWMDSNTVNIKASKCFDLGKKDLGSNGLSLTEQLSLINSLIEKRGTIIQKELVKILEDKIARQNI